MNNRVERVRSWPGRLREMGDRLTGGYVRTLIQRLRRTRDQLTGGDLRGLSSTLATKSLRIAMGQPILKALGRTILQPFPTLSARVYWLARARDTMVTPADTGATRASPPQRRDPSLLVNSLYKTAFGRIAD